MDGNSGRAVFNKTLEYKPLRKPHHIREDPPTQEPTRSTSVLSPEAPEFIPRNSSFQQQAVAPTYYNQNQNQEILTRNFSNMNIHNRNMHSARNMQSSSTLQHRLDAARGFPDGNYSHYIPPVENDAQESNEPAKITDMYPRQRQGMTQCFQTEHEKFAIDYIEDIVTYLNENPGSFDTIAAQASSVFKGFSENQVVLSISMEIIFNKSIEEQNFRYMGARLFALLDSINPLDGSVFRNLLNLKLSYHQSEILEYVKNDYNKVRGTTLFLAELYMQLRNDGVRIPHIAHNIVFCMKQLFMKTTPENIKCICLTLKLAGFDLEIDFPVEISEIMEQLRSLKKHIDTGTSKVIENVLILQKSNWGRSELPVHNSFPNEPLERLTDTPVFYGPDGQVLTEEENSFLEDNLPRENNVEEDIDSDEFDLDPEMTAEIKNDFKKFLKSNDQSQC